MNYTDWTSRLKRLAFAVGMHHRVTWRHCDACGHATPWITDAWQGIYRCTACALDHHEHNEDAVIA